MIFQTNHRRHDYIMPIERDEYIELEKTMKKAHMKKAVLVELVGDIYRANRDGYTLKNEKSSGWSARIIE